MPRPSSPALFVSLGALVVLGGCDRGPATWEEAGVVVHERCVGCHRDEGHAPFSLESWGQAAPMATAIAAAISEGRMPPWLPADRGVAFDGERRLTDREKALILRWVEEGALEGDPDRHPTAPDWPSGWALGEPDLVLRMEESYPVPAAGEDQFRNFVLRVPLERARYVRAVELRPTKPMVVHHATMRIDPTNSSRLEDARDSLPGFDEMFSRTEARPPGGFFLGWTPGRMPRQNPQGMAWTLEPGTDFIVQMHLRPTGMATDASAEVGLYFTDTRPTVSPTILRLGGQTMDIPAGEANYLVEDEFLLPVDVQAIGVYPHAHYVAREMTVWAELPDGSEVSIIDIPRWDFNWQDAYRYAEPLDLPAGSRLRLRYLFDNSAENPLNPNRPPRRVVYGPESDDEMAELWLQVITARPGDLPVLQREMALKDQENQLEGWNFLAENDPDDPFPHFSLGTVAQTAGDLDEAARRYRRALDAAPGFAQAEYNLGLIAEERGDLDGALARYRRATELRPEYGVAWSNLGWILRQRGELESARDAYEKAAESRPGDAEVLANLGSARREVGAHEEAIEALRRSLDLSPGQAPAHFSLALSLVEVGRTEEGLRELNTGLQYDGGNVAAALSVAWALATHPDESIRDGRTAAGLAAQIRAAVGPRARVLDVEAAGYAAAGRFDSAVQAATDAVAAAEAEGAPELPEIRERLERYRGREAWVRRPGG